MNHKVIVLAAGASSRFYPYNARHKSAYIIAGKTILEYTLESVKNAGIKEAAVVVRQEDMEFFKERININGLKVDYVVQKEFLGQGNAILAAKKYLNGPFFVINAHQINLGDVFNLMLDKFEKNRGSVAFATALTHEPWKYGVVEKKGEKVVRIIEKPEKKSEQFDERIVGIYLFKPEFLTLLNKVGTKEYQLEEAMNLAVEEGVLAVKIDEDFPMTLKYPWDLFAIKNFILKSLGGRKGKGVNISKTATIKGEVFFEDGVKVSDYGMVEGPAYLGKNSVVGAYSQVRGGSILEEGGVLQRYVDFKSSHLGENASIHSGFVGDSIIGADCKVGAGFITANKRLDRKEVFCSVKGVKTPTGLIGVGAFLGEGVSVGVQTSTMPGVIVGSGSAIMPASVVKSDEYAK